MRDNSNSNDQPMSGHENEVNERIEKNERDNVNKRDETLDEELRSHLRKKNQENRNR